ncbi:uncharacterized protein LOC113351815 [Papaver somniferum]|uniref:uncharacterized protein LOC113351815 n=1 Tax=Papaver somniferum TaxID=3469 RepID=UPI000E6F7F42|nr:uncharacterized protein LOC113351815 [Papaver somniferum]
MEVPQVDLVTQIEECPSIDLINNNSEDRYDVRKFSLIGRLDFLRIKFEDVVMSLKNQWKLTGQYKMIPLGNGFFTIKLENMADRNTIKAGKWEVRDQVLRVRNSMPNFRPENQITSLAMVWVHYPGLRLEYWDEKTLFTIRSAIGTPFKIDEVTLNYEIGLYARVLVEIDLAKKVPHNFGLRTNMQPDCRVKNNSNHEEGEKQKEGSVPTMNVTPTKIMKKFDICETPVTQINITEKPVHSTTGSIPSGSGKFGSLQDITEEEHNIVMDMISPAKVLQIVEDNSLDTSVVKYVNGKNGSVSEERIPTTSWSKVIQKPSTPAQNGAQMKNAWPKFCNKLNLPGMQSILIHNSVTNKKGNIWLFWNKTLPTPKVVSMSSQMITVGIGDSLISGVHVHVGAVQRRFLWSEMEMISELKNPWLILGDFNAITCAEEKIGGKTPNKRSMLDFNNCIDDCGLLQAPSSRIQHSCSNGQHGIKRILCILDRAMFNQLWFKDWGFKIGLRIASDHAPILGGCANIPKPRNFTYKFQKMWISHPNFMEIVQKSWSEPIIGDPAFVFQTKLKRLKNILKKWNWEVFGNVSVQIKEVEVKVQEAMEKSDTHPFQEELLNELVMAQNEFNSKEVQLNAMMKQKSREKCIKEGASNTNFFHTSIKIRQAQN